VASSQPIESASTNKPVLADDGVAERVARYLEDLERAPLATRTREAYASQVTTYGRWLAGRPRAAAALVQPRARDHAARDFKRYLKVEQGWKPSSVNLALAAVDHFNRFLGLGPAIVSREPLAQAAPRALSEDDQRALVRAAEDARPRDRAIVVLLLYTALRLSELVALDVADARLSARKGLLVVRAGKGDFYREVPLNKPVRDALEARLRERATRAAVGEAALFVGPQGRRLSARAVDLAIRSTARRAGLALSAHVLRHTCVTNLVRGGNDIVLVAELAGHRRLETTRRYSLPSAADRQAAMDALEIEP
jgi:site-specific recombinase XerD